LSHQFQSKNPFAQLDKWQDSQDGAVQLKIKMKRRICLGQKVISKETFCFRQLKDKYQ